VIDVGAGQSPWREWLPTGSTYTGLDIAVADQFGMTAKDDIIFYDGGAFPFPPGCFDTALCIEVLEHAQNPEYLLREIARTLRAGGTLILSVPWSARRHHIPFDFHRFTRERLAALLSEAGFDQVEIQERGDDIAVIANKLLVVTMRLAKAVSLRNFFLSIPLALIFGGLSFLMLVLAHISMALDLGSREDPLGYFCIARKAPI